MTHPAKQVGKISVECPQCGATQLESVYAKSTICRRCAQHIDLTRHQEEEQAAARGFSLFDKFGKLLSRQTTRAIGCFTCGAQQHVSSAAKSTICPHCATYIDLRDFKVSGVFNRSIQTQGDLIVTAKGDVTSTKVVCGSATIMGRVRGNVICSGTTTIRMKGRIPGGIESHHLILCKGSEVEFVRPVKVGSAEVLGYTSAIIMAEGEVVIRKHASLEGTLHAKSLTIEKGGIFQGELYIGQQELAQAELLSAADDEQGALGVDSGGSLAYGQAG